MRSKLQEVVCFLGLALAFVCAPPGIAQYPAGLSSTGPAAAKADKDAREGRAKSGSYNLKIGQVKFRVGVGLQQEYNDNINLASSSAKESDFITTPNLTLNTFWPFSKLNTLDLTLGVGYSKYWQHPELDTQSILISPDSMLDFNVYVGDVRIHLYEMLSIQEDPVGQPQLSGTSKFRRLENTAGINLDWDLNRIVLSGGYQHYTFKALNSGSVTTDGQTFGGLDHDVDSVFGQAGYKVNPKMLAGVRGNYSVTTYSGTQQNGSTSQSYAVFLDGEVTKHISAALSAGYEFQTFDTGGSINDNSNFESYIYQMSVRHDMNRFYTHNVSLSRFAMPGIGTNYTEIMEIHYGFNWELIKDMDLNGGAYFQTVKDSGNGTASESADRYGFSVMGVYKLFRSWDLGLGYDFVLKDSDISGNDYMQNRVYLNLTYNF